MLSDLKLKPDGPPASAVNDENSHNSSSMAPVESAKLAISAASVTAISTRAAAKRNVLGDVSNLHTNLQAKSVVAVCDASAVAAAASLKTGELLPAKRSFDPISAVNFDTLSSAATKSSILLPKQITKSAVPLAANRPMDRESISNMPSSLSGSCAVDGQKVVGRTLMGPIFEGGQAMHRVAALKLGAGASNDSAVFCQSKGAAAAPQARAWDDLDAADASDPLMVSEYVAEIIEYMRKLETQTLPDPNYIASQKELEWSMRSMLMDWVIEIHYKLKLLPETLFIAANIIDRFLSARAVSVTKLQLVGIAGLLIASKYEEVVSPSVSNFAYLSDNAYDEKEILKAERYMLQVLNYNLCYPNPMTFLRRISKADSYDIKTRTLAKYFMEVVLLEESLLACVPSMVAAASVWISRKMLEKGSWNANLHNYSGYSETEIIPYAKKVIEYMKKPLKYEAVYNKYSSKKFMKASVFAQEYLQNSTKCFI